MTLVWAPGYNGITDPDAQTYIAAVEAADGQAIEGNVAYAVNDFVVGCKLDGIWDAIKASCILAGARTLSGALVPLKGTAPANTNFVSADYNRETGLKSDGTKALDSNRNNNVEPQNNRHLSVWVSESATASAFGGDIGLYTGAGSGNSYIGRSNALYNLGSSSPLVTGGTSAVTGFRGITRTLSTSFNYRAASSTSTIASTSVTPASGNIEVFRGGSGLNSNARLSFYSIGESIDLEQLDTRTTRLMNLISYSLASGLPDLSTMDIDAALYIGAGYRAGGTLS